MIHLVIRFLKKIKKIIRYWIVRLIVICRKDKYHLLWIDPFLIEQTISIQDKTLKGNSSWHIGTIQDGNWDRGGIEMKKFGNLYPILLSHCFDNKPLEQIPEFLENIEKIKVGINVDNCFNLQNYKTKLKATILLLNTIKNEGYKTQKELGTNNIQDEIRVQIGRDGNFLFEEGFHRIVIAQLLKLEKIPVVVYRRHSDWAKLRNSIIDIVAERGFFHQPFNHPDLDSIAQLYGNHLKNQAFYGNERWDYIDSDLELKSGTVLDIGSYEGYFCHKFEKNGFDCYAVENDPKNLSVLKMYRDIKNRQFKVYEMSIFEIPIFKFDIVLALNIFHHLIKTKESYYKLIELLQKLDCKIMYFEPHQNTESGIYRKYSDKEFINFVSKYTGLNNIKFLGETKEGRNLYRMSKING